MTVVANNVVEGLLTSDTGEWIAVVEAAGPTNARYHNIWTCVEVSSNLAQAPVHLRILLDGEVVNEETYRPLVAQDPRICSPFGRVLLTEGQHSLTLQFKTGQAGVTAFCRRARIMVMQD